MDGNTNSYLRKLPKVDILAAYVEAKSDGKGVLSQRVILDSCRNVIDRLRDNIIAGKIDDIPSLDDISALVVEFAKKNTAFSLRPVVNATGIVIHTNLGRAVLSEKVAENVKKIASSYSTLEYSLERGERGSRHSHIESLICKLTGAEAAMAVNNNAAAIMLALTAVCKDREVIVSRGELVEIGGSFRVPEIMAMSGTILREVGTTNKTKLADYKKAIDSEKTAALLKVHTSNFKVVGFTESVDIQSLSALAKEKGLPLIYDLGSGLMAEDNLAAQIGETTVMDCVRWGVDIICFSGDKLFGGPQAGIIAGRKEYIDALKSNQLARVVRIDKLTLAALEATLRFYLDSDQPSKEIPVLSGITIPIEELEKKAKRLHRRLAATGSQFTFSVKKSESQVGGGSAPGEDLESYVIEIASASLSAQAIEKKLRDFDTPIIARINKGCVLMDVRTIAEREFDTVVSAFRNIMEGLS